jgi:hypothetical protein
MLFMLFHDATNGRLGIGFNNNYMLCDVYGMYVKNLALCFRQLPTLPIHRATPHVVNAQSKTPRRHDADLNFGGVQPHAPSNCPSPRPPFCRWKAEQLAIRRSDATNRF